MNKKITLITIDKRSNIEISQQLFNSLKTLIVHKRFADKELLPSKESIATTLKIPAEKVDKAFQLLMSENLIVAQGKDYQVSYTEVSSEVGSRFVPVYEEIIRKGMVPRIEVLEMKEMTVAAKEASLMRFEPGESVMKIRRLYFGDNQPLALVTQYVSLKQFPDLRTLFTGKEFLHKLYKDHLKIKGTVKHSFKLIRLPEDVASLFNEPKNASGITVMNHLYDQHGHVIEFGVTYFVPRYYFKFSIRKNGQ